MDIYIKLTLEIQFQNVVAFLKYCHKSEAIMSRQEVQFEIWIHNLRNISGWNTFESFSFTKLIWRELFLKMLYVINSLIAFYQVSLYSH